MERYCLKLYVYQLFLSAFSVYLFIYGFCFLLVWQNNNWENYLLWLTDEGGGGSLWRGGNLTGFEDRHFRLLLALWITKLQEGIVGSHAQSERGRVLCIEGSKSANLTQNTVSTKLLCKFVHTYVCVMIAGSCGVFFLPLYTLHLLPKRGGNLKRKDVQASFLFKLQQLWGILSFCDEMIKNAIPWSLSLSEKTVLFAFKIMQFYW